MLWCCQQSAGEEDWHKKRTHVDKNSWGQGPGTNCGHQATDPMLPQMDEGCLHEGIEVDKQPTNWYPEPHHNMSNMISWKARMNETIPPPSGNHYWSRGRNVSNTSHSKNCMRHVMVASKLSWQDRHLHSRINDYPHRKFDVCSHKTNSKHDDRLLTSRMQMDKAGENGHKANKGVLSLPPQCKSP